MFPCTYITSHSHSVRVNTTLYSGNNLNFSMKDIYKVKECFLWEFFLTFFFPEVHLGDGMLNLDKEPKSCGRHSSRFRSRLCVNHSSSSTTELLIRDLYDIVLCIGAQSCWKRKHGHTSFSSLMFTLGRIQSGNYQYSCPGNCQRDKYIRLVDKSLPIHALLCFECSSSTWKGSEEPQQLVTPLEFCMAYQICFMVVPICSHLHWSYINDWITQEAHKFTEQL